MSDQYAKDSERVKKDRGVCEHKVTVSIIKNDSFSTKRRAGAEKNVRIVRQLEILRSVGSRFMLHTFVVNHWK